MATSEEEGWDVLHILSWETTLKLYETEVKVRQTFVLQIIKSSDKRPSVTNGISIQTVETCKYLRAYLSYFSANFSQGRYRLMILVKSTEIRLCLIFSD